MLLTTITLTSLFTTALIDRHEPASVDEIYANIENGTLIRIVWEKAGERLIDWRAQEAEELIGALRPMAGAVTPQDLGVTDPSNGFLFFNALLMNLIQVNTMDTHLRLE